MLPRFNKNSASLNKLDRWYRLSGKPVSFSREARKQARKILNEKILHLLSIYEFLKDIYCTCIHTFTLFMRLV